MRMGHIVDEGRSMDRDPLVATLATPALCDFLPFRTSVQGSSSEARAPQATPGSRRGVQKASHPHGIRKGTATQKLSVQTRLGAENCRIWATGEDP